MVVVCLAILAWTLWDAHFTWLAAVGIIVAVLALRHAMVWVGTVRGRKQVRTNQGVHSCYNLAQGSTCKSEKVLYTLLMYTVNKGGSRELKQSSKCLICFNAV